MPPARATWAPPVKFNGLEKAKASPFLLDEGFELVTITSALKGGRTLEAIQVPVPETVVVETVAGTEIGVDTGRLKLAHGTDRVV
jgi:hypothetical protein